MIQADTALRVEFGSQWISCHSHQDARDIAAVVAILSGSVPAYYSANVLARFATVAARYGLTQAAAALTAYAPTLRPQLKPA